MATAYDTWKTDVPVDDEGEWVAKRRGEIFREWRTDRDRLRESIEAAMADDDDGMFPRELAAFFAVVAQDSTDAQDADAAQKLWMELKHAVFNTLRDDAEAEAQAQWYKLPRSADNEA